jgi:nicotinate-nucleotide adenylyltransferase
MKIGLLGGTFDPVHYGHITLAQKCLEHLGLDKLVLVPSKIPPHKDQTGVASITDRLAMLELAIPVDRKLGISTYEAFKETPAYTIETIEYFKTEFNEGTEFFYAIGSDWIGKLSTWNNADKLKKMVTFVVAKRPDNPITEKDPGFNIEYIDMEEINISSSEIREHIKSGTPITPMVPPPVEEYIRRKKLYQVKM